MQNTNLRKTFTNLRRNIPRLRQIYLLFASDPLPDNDIADQLHPRDTAGLLPGKRQLNLCKNSESKISMFVEGQLNKPAIDPKT